MRKSNLRAIIVSLALVLVMAASFGGGYLDMTLNYGDLVTFVDGTGDDGEISDEETPLAGTPVVTTKKSSKTSTSYTTLKTKATRTSKTTSKRTVKKTVTRSTTTKRVKTETVTCTTTTKQLTKNSYKQKTIVKVDTTVTTTTSKLDVTKKSISNISSVAPKTHSNVLAAYNQLGFKTNIDSTVNYSGRFSAGDRNIILQKENDDAVYHELGHFVAFLSGNSDTTTEFKSIFAQEKSKFKGTRGNDTYILSSVSEYFAESYQDYVERPSVLKSERPLTYNYIVTQVAKITSDRAALYLKVYGPYWERKGL